MQSDPLLFSAIILTRMSADSRALCVVCGAPAIGRNFDAYTCLSCKAFFRRNGYNEQLRYTCRVIGACPITIATRRHCSACRLNKCFERGMKKELIRSLIAIQNSTSFVHPSTPRLTTMNVIPMNDNLSLLAEDWSLLTYIRQAYDEYCLQTFVQSHQSIPLMLTTQPCRSRFKLQRFVDLKWKYFHPLCLFIKRILQIDSSLIEHYDLIKENCKPLLTLNNNELMKSNVLEHIPWEHDRHLVESVLSKNLIERLEENLRAYQMLVPYDPLIMKLFLVILALTSSTVPVVKKSQYKLKDFHRFPLIIFQQQNQYLTLLWKYIIYRLDHQNAVIYFIRFIQIFLRRQMIESEMIEILQNRDDQGQLLDALETATNC